MKVVITGGTGFLGRALAASLASHGHEVVVLSRFAGGTYMNVRHVRAQVQNGRFDAAGTAEIGTAQAVINLAGAGIADARWTPARKAVLRESRLSITRACAAAISESVTPPAVLISGSAIGIYGSSLDTTFTEASAPGTDFLAQLCADWEQAALAVPSRTRVVLLRTGLVIARDGGLLTKLKPPFKMFVGGPAGDGRHWMSWIHRDDWIGLVEWALTHDDVKGALNAVAPAPVTNTDFSKALGQALHRPSLFPVPAFVLRLMFGELADGAVLASQKVTPQVALAGGYPFKYSDIRTGMAAAV